MKKQAAKFNFTEIEKTIGYTFKDKSLLLQAFTRTSFCNENTPKDGEKYQSNEVLEFFGDGVLSVAIISFMLNECAERYSHGIRTELNEGDFSNIKSKLSDKQNLSKSMRALGLQKHLRMGEGDARLGIAEEPSVMEDLFESIVGAIYVDSGMSIDAVIKSVAGMLDMSVYTDRAKPMQSSKNALQEWCADKKHRLPAPRYETLSEDGPDHKKTYMRGCYVGDELVGRGIGKNFKIADAAAADDALQRLIARDTQNMQPKVDISKPKSQNKTTAAHQGAAKKPVPAAKPASQIDTAPSAKNESPYLTKLRAHAAEQKKPSPTFKDLGSTGKGDSVRCRVECRLEQLAAIGEAATRRAAMESAAMLMLMELGVEKSSVSARATAKKHKPKSTTPVKKQATAPTGTGESTAPVKKQTPKKGKQAAASNYSASSTIRKRTTQKVKNTHRRKRATVSNKTK